MCSQREGSSEPVVSRPPLIHLNDRLRGHAAPGECESPPPSLLANPLILLSSRLHPLRCLEHHLQRKRRDSLRFFSTILPGKGNKGSARVSASWLCPLIVSTLVSRRTVGGEQQPGNRRKLACSVKDRRRERRKLKKLRRREFQRKKHMRT